ncbi:MAG: rRNA maturation RNase YbeY [bacterium]|jgi:rRNA maturation RNase YbeY|nr:rRNA maturation RNase YbeY [bacterium]MDD3624647.1 rRNA maturation RNase YbeY [Proteiniphilum sp.]MDD4459129.1 rRNA maturation RNase YbeY [Proteiniphilum sp.]
MAIRFQSEKVPFPETIKKRETANWIRAVAAGYGKKVGELSYLFCDDEKILEVNRHYLRHDFYTDIITFDYSEGEIISGDILISLETVRSNSQKYQTAWQEELRRVIIHGVLHLCGLKDKTREEEKSMRVAEEEALKLLRKNPANLQNDLKNNVNSHL